MWTALFFCVFIGVSVSSSIPSIFADDGGNGHDDNPISRWSSTIGIVTAIIGNILISFALNIQRYAHIRIARQRERRGIQNGWKRGSPGSTGRQEQEQRRSIGGTYGTVAQDSVGGTTQQNGESNGDYQGEVRNRGSSRNGEANEGGATHTDDASDGHNPLKQSFLSERTVTSLEKDSSSNERESYLRSPYWWTGIILMTTGEAGNFLAYGFAPASIVSPLGVVALVSNCIIAPFMLKEKFRQQDFWGVLVAIAGAVTVVLSANTSEKKIGPDDIMGMITRWEFELYLGLTIGLILVLMWISGKYGPKTILIDLGLVGLFGGYTALSTKGVSSLLSYKLWHIITFPITYALVGVLVFSATMQIRYINRALQRFDSTQVIPTQFVLFTLSVIIGSAILYRDFESLTLKQGLQFFGGCVLTFFGVYLITSGRTQDDDGEESEQDEEEVIGLLQGPPYRDSIDWPDQDSSESHPAGRPSPMEERGKSRRGSILSDYGIGDEDEDGTSTPRAPRSSSPTSIPHSLSDVSILASESSPEFLATNPWAQRHEPPDRTILAEDRPSTPPARSSVILQFPTAPGVTTSPLEAQMLETPRAETIRHRSRRHTISRTPRSSSRVRMALRFSPGPLLTPLSGGLSAVVAESLRRGEGSPEVRRRKNRIRPTHSERNIATRDSQEQDIEYETDTSLLGEGSHMARQLSGPELDRTRSLGPPLSFPSPLSVHRRVDSASPGNGVQEGRDRKDSWTDNLARFGASLRMSGRKLGKFLRDTDHDQNNPSNDGTRASNAESNVQTGS